MRLRTMHKRRKRQIRRGVEFRKGLDDLLETLSSDVIKLCIEKMIVAYVQDIHTKFYAMVEGLERQHDRRVLSSEIVGDEILESEFVG